MSDTEYTPTDVDVQVRYALDRGSAIQRPYSTALADFDRWLAAHDAELTERVRSETLKAAAADFARAAHAGIEPELNMLAAKLLSDRAARSAPETEQAAIRKAGTNA